MKGNKIINTFKDENHPSWLFGACPELIEAQEAAGQRQMVESENILPVKPSAYQSERNIEELRKLGIKQSKPLKDDPLFCRWTLPDGWSIEASEHDMWSYIVDEAGYRKVAIFYKAAFYDRDAFYRVLKEGQDD